jgi:hypothetical protein
MSQTGKKTLLLKEFVDDAKMFAEIGGNLKLGDFLKGVSEGHLRRSFAMFSDTNGFNQYIMAVNEGRAIPNHLLDEKLIPTILADVNQYGNSAKYINEYQQVLKASGKTGITLTKMELFEHMVQRGIKDGVNKTTAATQAKHALLKLHETAQPQIEGVVKNLRNLEAKYLAQKRQTSEYSAFFSTREDLTDETLAVLGEFARPAISAYETITGTQRRLPVRDFLYQAYKAGKQHGYVKTHAHTDQFGTAFVKVAEDPRVFGALADHHIHPRLYDELTRVFRQGNNIPPELNRLRSMISGGFLAAPNITFANLVGGITTSFLLGVNPLGLMNSMGRTVKSLRKDGGRTDPLMTLLRQHVPIDFTSLPTQDIERGFDAMRKMQSGITPGGLRGFLSDLQMSYQKQLEAPFGAKWAGLEGFQFTEKWIKLSVFRTQLDDLIGKYGDDAAGMAEIASKHGDRVRDAAEKGHGGRDPVPGRHRRGAGYHGCQGRQLRSCERRHDCSEGHRRRQRSALPADHQRSRHGHQRPYPF